MDQVLAEWIADALVVVEAAVQALHVLGRHQVEEVLVEVRADEVSTALRETRVVKLLEKRREPRRDDRVEDHFGATGRDLGNGLAVVGVIEGEVFLANNRAAV